MPTATLSRAQKTGSCPDISRKLDFISKIRIHPLMGNNKKLVEWKIYHIFIGTEVTSSGTSIDIGSGYGDNINYYSGTKYATDLAVNVKDEANLFYEAHKSIFKLNNKHKYCTTNFARSDDWSFSLDSGCVDAEIVSQDSNGSAFIKIKSATDNVFRKNVY